MYKFIVTIILCLLCPLSVFSTEILEIVDCHIKYEKRYSGGYFGLNANVYVVTDNYTVPDFYVYLADEEYPGYDISVYRTNSEPSECGEWRFVDDPSKARFTIKFVDDYDKHFDFRIRYVDSPEKAGVY